MKTNQSNRHGIIHNIISDDVDNASSGVSINCQNQSREYSRDGNFGSLLKCLILIFLLLSTSLTAAIRSDGSSPFDSGESHKIKCNAVDTLRLTIPLKKYFIVELWPDNSKCGKFLKQTHDNQSSQIAKQMQIGFSDGSNDGFGGDEKIILSGVLTVDSGSLSLMFKLKDDTIQQPIQIRTSR